MANDVTTQRFTIQTRVGLAEDLGKSLYFKHVPDFTDEDGEKFQKRMHQEEHDWRKDGLPNLYLQVNTPQGSLQAEIEPKSEDSRRSTSAHLDIRDHHNPKYKGTVLDRLYAAMDPENPETVHHNDSETKFHQSEVKHSYQVSGLGLQAEFALSEADQGTLKLSHPQHGELFLPCAHRDNERYSNIQMVEPVERYPELFKINFYPTVGDPDRPNIVLKDCNTDAKILCQAGEDLKMHDLTPDQHALIGGLHRYLIHEGMHHSENGERHVNPTGISDQEIDAKFSRGYVFPGLAAIDINHENIATIVFKFHPEAPLVVRYDAGEQSIRPGTAEQREVSKTHVTRSSAGRER